MLNTLVIVSGHGSGTNSGMWSSSRAATKQRGSLHSYGPTVGACVGAELAWAR